MKVRELLEIYNKLKNEYGCDDSDNDFYFQVEIAGQLIPLDRPEIFSPDENDKGSEFPVMVMLTPPEEVY